MSKKTVKKQETSSGKEVKNTFLFDKTNFYIMIAGLVFIIVGFILMAGGGSDDPNVFNEDIYSFRRIRLAPTLILIGLGLQVYAILFKSKK
jgi:hypothetical protein